MTYYTTTTLTGDQLLKYRVKADSQERLIYAIFKEYGCMTASECLATFPRFNTPLTSIRRAFSNLYDRGLIHKSHETKIGIYGRPEHFYIINKDETIDPITNDPGRLPEK
jgi:predicted transcriptional regulator